MRKVDDVGIFLDCVQTAKSGMRIGSRKTDQNLWAWVRRRKPPTNAARFACEQERLKELGTRLWELLAPANQRGSGSTVWNRLNQQLAMAFKGTKHSVRLMYKPGQKWDPGRWKAFVTGLCPVALSPQLSKKRKLSKQNKDAKRFQRIHQDTNRRWEHAAPIPNHPPTDGFQERSEMQKARKLFEESLKLARTVRLHLSGFHWNGKTQIARKLAAEFGAYHFPGGRIEVPLQGSSPDRKTVSQALAFIIRQYIRDTRPLPEDESVLRQMWLQLLEDRRSLVILDDAGKSQDISLLIPPAPSWVIVTSQSDLPIKPTDAISVGELGLMEARELIIRLGMERRITSTEVTKLVDNLGGHAGSINALMDTICRQRPDIPIEDVLRELERNLWKKLKPYERVLEFKYASLSDSHARIWRRLAIFPSDFDGAAAAAICGNPARTEDLNILSDLRSWNCVEYHPGNGRYRLQDLHRKFLIKRKLRCNEAVSLEQRHATHYFGQIAMEAGLRRNRSTSFLADGRLTNDLTNVEAAFLWASKNRPDLCLTFVKDAHRVLFYGLRVKQTVGWVEQALAQAGHTGDHRGLALATHLLAVGRAWQARHLDAQRLYKKAQAHMNKVITKDHAWWNDMLLIEGGIGWALNDNQEEGAIQYFRGILRSIRREKRSGYKPEVLMYLYVIEGLAESFLRSRKPRPLLAVRCYRQMEKLLQPDQYIFERQYYSHLVERGIGWSCSLLNQHGQAAIHLKRAVDLARKEDQGPKVAVSLGKMGFAQIRAKEWSQARDSLEEGLDIAMAWQLFGYASEIWLDRCKVLYALGSRDEAIEDARRLLEFCEQLQLPRIVTETQAWLDDHP